MIRRAEHPPSPPLQQRRSRFRTEGVALAIAIGMLPVLAVGTAIHYFGNRVITEQVTHVTRVGAMGLAEVERIQERQLNLLSLLLLGTGVTALLSGAIAAFGANRSLSSAMAVAQTVPQPTDEHNPLSNQADPDSETVAEPTEPTQTDIVLQGQGSDQGLDINDTASEVATLDPLPQPETVTAGISRILAIADSARTLAATIENAQLDTLPASQLSEKDHTEDQSADNLSAIQATFVDAATKAKHLGEPAHKISQVVSLIDDLATQINQKVINATIKAGQVGVTGQPSVISIAETVRSLTCQISRKAVEIEPLVIEIETEANTVATEIETGTKHVIAKVELPQETWQKTV